MIVFSHFFVLNYKQLLFHQLVYMHENHELHECTDEVLYMQNTCAYSVGQALHAGLMAEISPNLLWDTFNEHPTLFRVKQ